MNKEEDQISTSAESKTNQKKDDKTRQLQARKGYNWVRWVFGGFVFTVSAGAIFILFKNRYRFVREK